MFPRQAETCDPEFPWQVSNRAPEFPQQAELSWSYPELSRQAAGVVVCHVTPLAQRAFAFALLHFVSELQARYTVWVIVCTVLTVNGMFVCLNVLM